MRFVRLVLLLCFTVRKGGFCCSRCQLWHPWLLVQPTRCGAPGVVLCPHTTVCGARGASGWVFASLLLFPGSCFCLLCKRARSVLLTLLLFCSVLRVLAVCCCASSCAAASYDLLRSRHKYFCMCNLVDVNKTHTALQEALGGWPAVQHTSKAMARGRQATCHS